MPRSISLRFQFFLLLIACLGVLTLFSNTNPQLLNSIVGSIMVFSSILGYASFKFKKLKIKIKCVGFLLAFSIYLNAALQATEVFTSNDSPILHAIDAIVWFGYAFSFMTNWSFLLEPFLEIKRSARSSYDLKKNPPCIGCQEK